jgi:hypothetical protein
MTMTEKLWKVAGTTLGFALMIAALGSVAHAQVGTPNAPEIDAGSAASALTLLVGGAMLLKDKFRVK